ncbi:unnamed protein product [Symbiodinium natans]|uniref:Uncharacterized protein n=1 Tax=Symbiodinium natans TaxID=878477 RepID=A0A812TPX7_9DINO|nr:unnamed protein product [Symbiodinium natans]
MVVQVILLRRLKGNERVKRISGVMVAAKMRALECPCFPPLFFKGQVADLVDLRPFFPQWRRQCSELCQWGTLGRGRFRGQASRLRVLLPSRLLDLQADRQSLLLPSRLTDRRLSCPMDLQLLQPMDPPSDRLSMVLRCPAPHLGWILQRSAAPGKEETAKAESAFEGLGMRSPPTQGRNPPDQAERFIAAIIGEKRSIPSWSGQPNTLRSWLKLLLAHWESETTVLKEKWGIRLYQSFPENSDPRRIADQIELHDVLSARGYGMILTCLMQKYKPYLDVVGPASIDRFFYGDDRAKGQSFASYIAQKQVARQEMESNLNEKVSEKIAGRILWRHAHLSEFQRELVALRDVNTLLSFEQVASLLRPLDRPELRQRSGQALSGDDGSGRL